MKNGRSAYLITTRGIVHETLRAHSIAAGSVRLAMIGRDRAFIDWLCGQTEKDTKVIDTLLAIAVDTYNEEKGTDK